MGFHFGSKPCLVFCQSWGLSKWRHETLLFGPWFWALLAPGCVSKASFFPSLGCFVQWWIGLSEHWHPLILAICSASLAGPWFVGWLWRVVQATFLHVVWRLLVQSEILLTLQLPTHLCSPLPQNTLHSPNLEGRLFLVDWGWDYFWGVSVIYFTLLEMPPGKAAALGGNMGKGSVHSWFCGVLICSIPSEAHSKCRFGIFFLEGWWKGQGLWRQTTRI